jgi:hypothetical protein
MAKKSTDISEEQLEAELKEAKARYLQAQNRVKTLKAKLIWDKLQVHLPPKFKKTLFHPTELSSEEKAVRFDQMSQTFNAAIADSNGDVVSAFGDDEVHAAMFSALFTSQPIPVDDWYPFAEAFEIVWDESSSEE